MHEFRVLFFVDDEPVANRLFQRACRQIGYQCEVFTTARSCLERIDQKIPDLVLTDLNMPGMDGFGLIESLSTAQPLLPIVAITGQSTVERAVQAMRAGASDFLKKPYALQELEIVVERCLKYSQINEENYRLRTQVNQSVGSYGIAGESTEICHVFKLIDKLAEVDCPVVIQGESGTGKELAAKAIHDRGPRCSEPFIVIDCGSVPDTLLESELFGHSKGAFTGADSHRTGLLEAAHKGTVFLDEIGNISSSMQAKLLRVCQEKTITPIGSSRTESIHARFIAASNQNLEELVKKGEFRHDLYHRLNVVTLTMPGLAERREDIPILVEQFSKEFAIKYGRPPRSFSSNMLRHLSSRNWPGNVRELRNFVERCVIMTDSEKLDGGVIQQTDNLQINVTKQPISSSDKVHQESLAELETRYIREVLESVSGNQAHAAKILGINRTTLWRKLHSQ